LIHHHTGTMHDVLSLP